MYDDDIVPMHHAPHASPRPHDHHTPKLLSTTFFDAAARAALSLPPDGDQRLRALAAWLDSATPPPEAAPARAIQSTALPATITAHAKMAASMLAADQAAARAASEAERANAFIATLYEHAQTGCELAAGRDNLSCDSHAAIPNLIALDEDLAQALSSGVIKLLAADVLRDDALAAGALRRLPCRQELEVLEMQRGVRIFLTGGEAVAALASERRAIAALTYVYARTALEVSDASREQRVRCAADGRWRERRMGYRYGCSSAEEADRFW